MSRLSSGVLRRIRVQAAAAVNLSGDFVTGYVFNYDKDSDTWKNWVFGQDNIDTNQTELNIGIADDSGIWAIDLSGEVILNGSSMHGLAERMMGSISVDLAKLIAGADTDWNAKLQHLANDRIIGLRAYTNKSGLNYDRIRTNAPGLWANAIVGYGDLLQVQFGGAPALSSDAGSTDKIGNGTKGDFIVSAMTKPISGLAVSVDWALVGDGGSPDSLLFSKDGYAGEKMDGVVGGAADVNIGELLGLDWNIGVGIADKYCYGEDVKTNILAAQVYGGFDLLQAYAEYANENNAYLEENISRLHFGLDLNALEGLILDIYTGTGDVEKWGEEHYVGGNIGYEIAGAAFQLNLQYSEGPYLSDAGSDISETGVGADGFSITPMLKVSS